jgi:hypothetical protein
MLALDRPLGVVADLALFADHADRKRVYYIPTRPRLARVDGVPELSFVKFRQGDAASGGVGLLSFTTELVAGEPQLEEARRFVVKQGIDEPMLVQVPWIDGRAVFAAALAEGDGFVEKLYGDVKPDLAGTNRAMFSMLLNQEGARLVEALVAAAGPSALGVRYELGYAGLRPAFQVHMRADYKRIYTELSWGFQFGVAYEGIGVRASVESATQKLIQSGAIQIEVLHFTDSADLQAKVDAAVHWFQEKILEDFFKTALQPAAHEDLMKRALDAVKAMGAGTLQDALKDASMLKKLAEQLGIPPDVLKGLGAAGAGGGGAGGGAASQSSFALKLQFTFRDIKQEELKTITLDWSQAQAEKRTAAPQGLLSRIGGAPAIIEAEDSGTFWDRIDVTVRPLGDFAALGVHTLVVQLAYPDENAPQQQSALVFARGETAPKRFTAWTNGHRPQYRARVEARFDDQGPWPGPPVFTGAWQTLQSLDLAVHPLTGIPRIEVELSPGTLLFAETPQAQVDLRLDGQIVATHMLTDAKPTAMFRRRLDPAAIAPAPAPGDPAAAPPPPGPTLESRTTWFLAGGKRVQGEWGVVEGTACLVHNPWKSTRTIRLLPMLPDDFVEALVTLTMIEPTRTETAELRFEPGERKAKSISLTSLAEQPPPVRIDTVVIRGDGSTFTGQPLSTSEPVVVIRDRDGVFRQVGVRLLAGPSLAAHGLIALQVQLLNPAGETIDTVVFTETKRDPGLLLVPVVSGITPSYRVIRYSLDGTAIEAPVEPLTAPELLVPAVAPA